MIADIDAALKALLLANMGKGTIDVSFDPPTKDWASRRSGPVINMFLADIREDLEKRTIDFIDIRNEAGTIVSRRPRRRTFQLTYALTAWAATSDDDHILLGSALRTLLMHDVLPPTPDRMFESGDPESQRPMPLRVGLPKFSDKLSTELWTAVGADYRPTLWVLIEVPVGAGSDVPAGPPQTEPPVFAFQDDDNSIREHVRGGDPDNPGRLRTRSRSTLDTSNIGNGPWPTADKS
jgi:Pvc16 N-terminal domain